VTPPAPPTGPAAASGATALVQVQALAASATASPTASPGNGSTTVGTLPPAPATAPSAAPTTAPTTAPTAAPTEAPTAAPTAAPTSAPTPAPTTAPSAAPTSAPTAAPTAAPTPSPTAAPATLLHATLLTHNRTLAEQAQGIATRLATVPASGQRDESLYSRLRIGAGAEVRASGALNLVGDFDLSSAAATALDKADAPTLTLRAAGALTAGYSLGDGFAGSSATAAARRGAAASFRLVAGADLSAAWAGTVRNDLAAADAPDLLIGRAAATASATAPDVLLRSTTGDIALAAAGDIRLASSAVRVYTTGSPVDSSTLDGWSRVGLAGNQVLGSGSNAVGPFFSGAGDLSLSARGDVVGSPSRQYVTDWWWRQTSLAAAGTPAAWWSRYDLFRQGLASFGGGDIRVRAGGSVVDLEVSTPASGYSVQATATLPAVRWQQPGGLLSVQADGDIVSGLFNAGGPSALLQAGGSIRSAADTGLGKSHPGAQLFYADTDWTLSARGDLTIGQITNPALLSGVVQLTGAARGDVITGLDNGAALRALAIAGDLRLAGTRTALASGDPRGVASDAARQVPGTLALAATAGDLRVDAPLLQRPAVDGDLALLAEGDVQAQRIVVAAASPAAAPQPLARISANLALTRDWSRSTEAVPGLDVSRREPVRIVAQLGDATLAADISSARPLQVTAGRDLTSTGSAAITLQHQAGGELSVLRAGRDIVLADNAAARLRLAGPGDLLLLAGRHVDLQGSAGITTIGNQDNPRLLAEGGASITVVAGVDWGGADYAQALAQGFQLQAGGGVALLPFLDRVYALAVSDTSGAPGATAYAGLAAKLQLDEALAVAQPAAWRTAVAGTMRTRSGNAALTEADAVAAWRGLPADSRLALADTVAAALPAWQQAAAALARRQTGQPALDAAAALAEWQALDVARRDVLAPRLALQLLADALPADTLRSASAGWLAALAPERQALLLHDALFDELRAAGRSAARLPRGAEREAAYQAGYAALALLYPGTRRAGDITLSASQIKTQQGGDIALLAPGGGVDAGALTGSTGKQASQLGVMTVAGGEIAAAVRDDFAVNQSRVFTLARGDLLLWSSEGSIDAGRGARTVTGAPPPVYRIDSNGNVVVDTSGSFSGSGIAVLDAASILDLYAPKGEISAGEAGIKPGGKFFGGAGSFRGPIEGNGPKVGAPPPPPAGGETAALASTAQSAASATAPAPASDEDDPRRKRAPRRQLLLEFLGFGQAD